MTSHRFFTPGSVNAVARHRVVIGFAAALSALVAQAADPSTTTLAMQAQKDYFSEKCFTLEQGQQISYELKTRYSIEFNLHHHPDDGETVFPDRLVVKSQHSKTVVAEFAGTYCFMATNLRDQPGDFDVVIKYEITK
jgi:hypothetical protein